MDKIIQPLHIPSLALSQPGHLLLVITVGSEKHRITELIAGLASRGRLQIVAGSDWVPGYNLAHTLRRRTVDVAGTLQQVRLGRAFTCFQLFDLLSTAAPDPDPLLVLDFLHTFYDADLPYPVRFRILKECCQHLTKLSQHKPVALVVQQTLLDDYGRFLPFLIDITEEILGSDLKVDTAFQPRLL